MLQLKGRSSLDKKLDPTACCLEKQIFKYKDADTLKVKLGKRYTILNTNYKKDRVTINIRKYKAFRHEY